MGHTPQKKRNYLQKATEYLEANGGPQKRIGDIAKYNSKLTKDDWKPIFLNAYAHTGSMNRACEIADVDIKTIVKLKKYDDIFREACKMAKADAVGKLEATAFELATKGERKGIYHQGVKVGEECVRSTKMIEWLLKHMEPEIYGDKLSVTGAQGEKDTFDLSKLTKEDIIQIHDILNKRQTTGPVVDAELVEENEEESEEDDYQKQLTYNDDEPNLEDE